MRGSRAEPSSTWDTVMLRSPAAGAVGVYCMLSGKHWGQGQESIRDELPALAKDPSVLWSGRLTVVLTDTCLHSLGVTCSMLFPAAARTMGFLGAHQSTGWIVLDPEKALQVAVVSGGGGGLEQVDFLVCLGVPILEPAL